MGLTSKASVSKNYEAERRYYIVAWSVNDGRVLPLVSTLLVMPYWDIGTNKKNC